MAKGKGSAYERVICKQLSLWWTQDLDEPRSDVFWRTSNSGGRATVRGRKGQTTAGHYGDISATDEVGIPLLKYFSIEVKRGYSKYTIADLFDKPPKAAKQMYEGFMEQASHGSIDSGALHWMLIAQRDRRLPLVIVHQKVWKDLRLKEAYPSFHFDQVDEVWEAGISGTTLEAFLKAVKPDTIKRKVKK